MATVSTDCDVFGYAWFAWCTARNFRSSAGVDRRRGRLVIPHDVFSLRSKERHNVEPKLSEAKERLGADRKLLNLGASMCAKSCPVLRRAPGLQSTGHDHPFHFVAPSTHKRLFICRLLLSVFERYSWSGVGVRGQGNFWQSSSTGVLPFFRLNAPS